MWVNCAGIESLQQFVVSLQLSVGLAGADLEWNDCADIESGNFQCPQKKFLIFFSCFEGLKPFNWKWMLGIGFLLLLVIL